MKIKSVHTRTVLYTLKYKQTFNSSEFKLEYLKDMNAILIDERCIVPMNNVLEIQVEQDEPKSVEVKQPTKKKEAV